MLERFDQMPFVGHSRTKTVMPIEVLYLRDQAQRCVRLARTCSDRKTSHALEAMAAEFMEKAAELDKFLALMPPGANDTGTEPNS